jgi:hypothetical protein
LTADDLLKDYCRLDEAAAALHVTERTIRRRIHTPDGWPYLKFGGRIWLHLPSIKKFLAAQTRSDNPRRRSEHRMEA